MAQIKIYGLRSSLIKITQTLSEAIHQSVMEALQYPPEKKFHRFIGLEPSEFIYPKDRSENYIIIEISMFEGRSSETKKALIKLLFTNIKRLAHIDPYDVEIIINESPQQNWGIRGLPGDELKLDYKVNI